MKEIRTAFALMLYALSKLSLFNAFGGAFAGVVYGMFASLANREFFGYSSTQITFLGVACLVVFLPLSIGLTMAGNYLVSDVDGADHVA